MTRTSGKDLTVGSVPRLLLAFALPMLLGNLLNTGYSIINTIWVGNILGGNAVGATAASFPIIFMLIALASGATMATTILISQYFGAKNFTMVRKVVNTSFAVSLLLAIILTIVGILASDTLLRLMRTPPEIFSLASPYLKISFAGVVFFYFSFLLSSILRGIGDTVTPLLFLVVATVLNAVLDPLLIIGIYPFPKLGLNGAAIASVIAQIVAVVLGMIYLNRKNPIVAFKPRELEFDRSIIMLIAKIGFPSMIQQTLVSVGAAFITSFVNGFGATAIAAFGAASRVDSLAMMPSMSMAVAASSLSGQNLGAGKPERINQVFKWGILMNLAMVSVVVGFAFFFPRLILSVFIHDPAIIEIGVHYLRIVAPGYLFFAVMFVSNGIINGSGRTMVTMFITLFALWLFRVPLAAMLSHTALGLRGIWLAMTIGFCVSMFMSLGYYFSGKWKKSVVHGVDLAPTMGTGGL